MEALAVEALWKATMERNSLRCASMPLAPCRMPLANDLSSSLPFVCMNWNSFKLMMGPSTS
eukprot:1204658-Lingulodinium_polyedra.AAC.1